MRFFFGPLWFHSWYSFALTSNRMEVYGVYISLWLPHNKTDSLRSKKTIAWEVTALGNFWHWKVPCGTRLNYVLFGIFFLRTLSCQASSPVLLQLQLSTFIYLPLLEITWDWVLFDSVSDQWKPINISTVLIVTEFIPSFKMNLTALSILILCHPLY